MTPSQARKTLEAALKDKQPLVYSKMKANGTLKEYLGRLAYQIQEQGIAAHQDLGNDRQFQAIKDPTLKVQEANSRIKAAEDVALQQAIEQISSLETTA